MEPNTGIGRSRRFRGSGVPRFGVPEFRRSGSDGGWTLIELLIVLSLILILTSMALTQYSNSITRTKEAALASDLYLMRDAIDQYYADKGKYPDSLQTLVSEHYIRQV